MRSVPRAVATGSSIDATVEFPKEDPVATALGTDLIPSTAFTARIGESSRWPLLPTRSSSS